MSRALRIEETVSLQWELDFTAEQRALLVRAADIGELAATRRWHQLRGDERDALVSAAVELLQLAEQLSGDLSG